MLVICGISEARSGSPYNCCLLD